MKTKFFRVAVEGATTDGRTIDGKALQEMAAAYNPATYAARVNLEHIRGVTPDGPFQAYGDVLSLRTEPFTLDIGGKQEQRLALVAEIEAFDPLIAMNQKKQKLYSSVEISPNFANTGKAYLMGLAVTDSPASLGTEMLQFCAQQGDKNPLASRKLDPANMFTAAEPIALEFVDEPGSADPAAGMFASVKAFFDNLGKPVEAPKVEAPVALPAAVAPDAAMFAELGQVIVQMASGIDAFTKLTGERFTALTGEVATIKQALEETPAPAFTARPLATGGTGAAKTDC